MRGIRVLFQLGSSYPDDQHIEDELVRRLNREHVRHSELLAAHAAQYHRSRLVLTADILRHMPYILARRLREDGVGERPGAARAFLSMCKHGVSSRNLLVRRAMLRAAVARQDGGDVVIVARSSGALVATRLASEGHRHIRGVVVLGYPFRNPNVAPEPGRFRHLAGLRVPTLILQGGRDPYGTGDAVRDYRLSDSIRVETVDTDHEFKLTPPGWDAVADRIRRFIDGLGPDCATDE